MSETVEVDDQPMRVRFMDRDLWWLKRADGTGPLAPLEHCDSEGHVTLDAVFSGEDSFAHVYEGGIIKRYGQRIGSVDDIVIIATVKE